MTSSRRDEVEHENDHDLSSKVNFFRESKRRKPPDASNSVFMHVQVKVQVQGEDECHGGKAGSSPRSGSTSSIGITPEVCGESDLTAENLMAEESSRSSNNDGTSSKYESAAESASKASSSGKPQAGSSLGTLHSFLDQPQQGKREIIPASESLAAVAYQRPLARKDDHNLSSIQMEDVNESEGIVAKLEPVLCLPLAPRLSTELKANAGTHSTSSPENEKWLQLGLGPSRNKLLPSRLDPAMDQCQGESPPFQQGNFDRKRKTPSLDYQISAIRESEFLPQNLMVAGSVQWEAQRGTVPHKFQQNIHDSSSTPGSHAFLGRLRTSGMPEMGSNYNLEKDNLYGINSTAPSAQIVFPRNCTSIREVAVTGNASAERNLQTMSRRLAASTDIRRQNHVDQPGSSRYPSGTENLILGGEGKAAGVLSRALPSFLLRPGDEVQFRSPQRATADHNSVVQFQRESRPVSLAALMQATEDQRQAAGQSGWLSSSDSSSAHKFIPLASNFHGWSAADVSTNTRAGTDSSGQPATELRHPNDMDQSQLQRDTDEWGNLHRKVSSGMLFPCQVQLPDGSSTEAIPPEGVDSTGTLKNVINNDQNTLQNSWASTIEATKFGPMASWCLNGLTPLEGLRADKLGNEDLLATTSMLQERPTLQLRFPDSEQILSSKQAYQRESWQPTAAGQPKLREGNRGSKFAAIGVSRQKLQALPPLPRETSQAGLWFTLQPAAAENENEEVGLPQITKAYLRIKDGKMSVSTVKKYLVTKLGLASDAEVDITCRGQPVVPSLPLQQVRDEIWYSTVDPLKDQTTIPSSCGEKYDFSPADQGVRQAAICSPTMFSKDVVMVLSYRRHLQSMPPSQHY
ncbi:hypothetical protein R1flu_001166 [Riccia fluitans]|uniref:Uncharacterized protein n=1 Tax=Riccia fluitans TaxID=41844 RepID=A0ABD1Y2I5_9MARC